MSSPSTPKRRLRSGSPSSQDSLRRSSQKVKSSVGTPKTPNRNLLRTVLDKGSTAQKPHNNTSAMLRDVTNTSNDSEHYRTTMTAVAEYRKLATQETPRIVLDKIVVASQQTENDNPMLSQGRESKLLKEAKKRKISFDGSYQARDSVDSSKSSLPNFSLTIHREQLRRPLKRRLRNTNLIDTSGNEEQVDDIANDQSTEPSINFEESLENVVATKKVRGQRKGSKRVVSQTSQVSTPRVASVNQSNEQSSTASIGPFEEPEPVRVVRSRKIRAGNSLTEGLPQAQVQNESSIGLPNEESPLVGRPIRASRRNKNNTADELAAYQDIVASQKSLETTEESRNEASSITFQPNIESTRVYAMDAGTPTVHSIVNEGSFERRLVSNKVTSTPAVGLAFHEEEPTAAAASATFSELGQQDDNPDEDSSCSASERRNIVHIDRIDRRSSLRRLMGGVHDNVDLKNLVQNQLSQIRTQETPKADVFKKPKTPPIVRRKPSVNPGQLFTPREVRIQFERHLKTTGKLTAGKGMPALLDVSQTFCSKMLKHLNKIVEQNGQKNVTLANVKEMMTDFGMIDGSLKDLFKTIQELVPSCQDRQLLLPDKYDDEGLPTNVWDLKF